MAKKKINLGVMFPEDNLWTGGVDYLLSLITSLQYLKSSELNYTLLAALDKKKILLDNKINKKNILFTNFFSKNHYLNYIRKVFLFLFKDDLILNFFINSKKINIFSHYKVIKKINSICWIPDLQHKYLKKNFSKKEIDRRDYLFQSYIKEASLIIVSSLDSKKKLISNYRISDKKKINILRFVPKINFNNINKPINKKYNLNKNYIYIPNQFWLHKNHDIIIKCAHELKKRKYFIQFVLSGDNSLNKKYFYSLFKKIENLGLNNYFNYLGMINRKDVSKLIFKSKAIINPSLFEGWNTSVEEAKIFKKKIILSDIPVHREQVPTNCFFFKKSSAKQLAKIIIKLKSQNNLNLSTIKSEYLRARKKFAFEYLDILKKVNLMY